MRQASVSEFPVLKKHSLEKKKKSLELEGKKRNGKGEGCWLRAAGSLPWTSSYEETTVHRSPYSER